MVWIEQADARTYIFPWKANVIIADPPQRHGRNAVKDLLIDGTFRVFTAAWITNVLRYLETDGVLCICCDPEYQYDYEKILRTYSTIHYRETLIWNYNFGLYTRKRFVKCHQVILVYERGSVDFKWKACAVPSQRMLSGDSRADARGRTPASVWSDIPRMPGNQRQRYSDLPQLPIKLVKRLLNAYGAKRVIDPMCGSGTVPTLCKYLKIPCVGLEVDEYVCSIAQRRLLEMDEARLV